MHSQQKGDALAVLFPDEVLKKRLPHSLGFGFHPPLGPTFFKKG
jgi:hypothetical protein